MKEMRAEIRNAAKDKVKRLTTPKKVKIGATGWTEPTDMNADAPTGMRPLSRRAYKKGGKVEGAEAMKRADRKPRKSGGATEYVNRNVKTANEDRDGVKHVGGMKRGGAAFEGTPKDAREDKKLARKHGMSMKEWEASDLDKKHDEQESTKGLNKGGRTKRGFGGVLSKIAPLGGMAGMLMGRGLKKKDDEEMNAGGRAGRKSGGRAKGTKINIVIAPQGGQQAQPPMPPAPPKAVPVPTPPPQAQGGPPPGMPPINISGLGGGMPQPMPRKRGGRTKMTAGSLSGEGRLQKIDLQNSGHGV